MHGLVLVLFAIVVGITASGIVASLYRLSGMNPESQTGRIVRNAVLVVAGPSVIFESAINGLLKKEWKPIIFWFVVGGLIYWCLAIGLFVLDVITSF